MRCLTITVMLAVVVMCCAQPALPGEVTVVQGGKSFSGWANDWGGIVILNPRGRTIMRGQVNRMGGVELTPLNSDETFVGRINPMGHGRLMSPRTGDTMGIEVER